MSSSEHQRLRNYLSLLLRQSLFEEADVQLVAKPHEVNHGRLLMELAQVAAFLENWGY
ncbi:hypothetical protein V6C20_00520 [Caldibacillus thermoamylovorans]